ncbi:hypothetical protein [Mesorhizobium sp.]|uniref:hypothetical protein n=1 Tax=Mesorhizobium sp. TaxID=1871066 RepID=UPI00338E2172
MGALPIRKPRSSPIPGKMNARGHDGHTAMLLEAAKYLAKPRKLQGLCGPELPAWGRRWTGWPKDGRGSRPHCRTRCMTSTTKP